MNKTLEIISSSGSKIPVDCDLFPNVLIVDPCTDITGIYELLEACIIEEGIVLDPHEIYELIVREMSAGGLLPDVFEILAEAKPELPMTDPITKWVRDIYTAIESCDWYGDLGQVHVLGVVGGICAILGRAECLKDTISTK